MPPNQFLISLLQVLKEDYQREARGQRQQRDAGDGVGGGGREWEREREKQNTKTTATRRCKAMNPNIKLREKKSTVYQCRGWGPPLVGRGATVSRPIKWMDSSAGRVMPRPHTESSIAPTEGTWKRKRTQRKREKHKNRRGFLLVSESKTDPITDTPDCSRHQSAMNRLIFTRALRQSKKEGEPKLHFNILRILVTAAESCKNHRQQTGQWQAESALT